MQADITFQDVEAVVNAANCALRPGGGVDGAITRAAGPDALADRERVIRERGNPPASPRARRSRRSACAFAALWIIHTGSPIYSGSPDDARLLASCHTECLRVADELEARTVAFPAISTGVYGYPIHRAAEVAVEAIRTADTAVDEVRFVLFDEDAVAAFERALG